VVLDTFKQSNPEKKEFGTRKVFSLSGGVRRRDHIIEIEFIPWTSYTNHKGKMGERRQESRSFIKKERIGEQGEC